VDLFREELVNFTEKIIIGRPLTRPAVIDMGNFSYLLPKYNKVRRVSDKIGKVKAVEETTCSIR